MAKLPPGIKKTKTGYQIRVTRVDHKTGRPRNLKGTTKNLRAAIELRESLVAEHRGGKHERIRLKDYAASWLVGRRGTLKPSVTTRYAIALDLHILPALGDMFVDAIEPSDVQQYVVERMKSGAAGNTVLNDLRLLRVMAKDARAAKLATSDFADRVKQPPVGGYTEEKPNLLRAEEVQVLLDAVPVRWRALVTLMAFTGLRWGEATGLRWEDISGLEIMVRRGNWRGVIVTPKTTKSHRRVPYPPQLAQMLADMRLERHAAGVDDGGYIFTTQTGTLIKNAALRTVLDRACRKAGVSRITAHGLRRTFIDLARREASMRVLQSITGHTTTQMIAHYSQPDAGERQVVLDGVAKRIARTGQGQPDDRIPHNPTESDCETTEND